MLTIGDFNSFWVFLGHPVFVHVHKYVVVTIVLSNCACLMKMYLKFICGWDYIYI